MIKGLSLLAIALFLFSCGSDNKSDSLSKKAAKFVTEQAIEAGKGVNEALKSDSGKIAESTAETAGELTSGAAKGIEKVTSEKGEEIGANLGKATGSLLSGFGRGLEEDLREFRWKVSESNSNDLQVLGINKTLVQGNKVNIYFRFLKGGKIKIKLDAFDKSCSKLLGSVTTSVNVSKYDFKAIDFIFNNSEPVKSGECMIVCIE